MSKVSPRADAPAIAAPSAASNALPDLRQEFAVLLAELRQVWLDAIVHQTGISCYEFQST